MRKILIASTAIASLAGLVIVAAPGAAQAQYNYGGYSGSIVVRPPAYAPPAYEPPPAPAYRPFFYTPPGYQGGGYYDYRRYGPPNTRDALDTCAYC
jgi:hypothetical protein